MATKKLEIPTFADGIKTKMAMTAILNNIELEKERCKFMAKMKKIQFDAYVKEGFSEAQALVLTQDIGR